MSIQPLEVYPASSGTESHAGHTGAEAAMQPRMTLNSWSFCIYFPRTGVHHHAGITGVHLHAGTTGVHHHAGITGVHHPPCRDSSNKTEDFLHAREALCRPSLQLLLLLVSSYAQTSTCALTTHIQVLEAIGVPDFGVFLTHSDTYKCTLRCVTMWVNITLVFYSGLTRRRGCKGSVQCNSAHNLLTVSSNLTLVL